MSNSVPWCTHPLSMHEFYFLLSLQRMSSTGLDAGSKSLLCRCAACLASGTGRCARRARRPRCRSP
eukprot:3546129-Pleurochrysis_carterae.AAC.3